MEGLKLGDRMKARINYGGEGGSLLPMEEGTVVYIHPEERFYTLRFDFPKGSFRESYPIAPPPEMLMTADDIRRFRNNWGHHKGWYIKEPPGQYLQTIGRKK